MLLAGSTACVKFSPPNRTPSPPEISPNTESDECRIPLESATLPNHLGAPITLRPVNDQTLSFLDLVPRNDGLYAMVDPHVRHCGCGERDDRTDRDITIRRLSWSNLGAPGETVFTIQGPFYVEQLVIGSKGQLFGLGQTKAANPYALFALNGTERRLRSYGETTYELDYSLGSIPPWDGGQ